MCPQSKNQEEGRTNEDGVGKRTSDERETEAGPVDQRKRQPTQPDGTEQDSKGGADARRRCQAAAPHVRRAEERGEESDDSEEGQRVCGKSSGIRDVLRSSG